MTRYPSRIAMDTLQERLAKLSPEQREGLLRKLQAQNKVAPVHVPAPTIPPVAHDTPLPLSFSQERLWLIEQILPGQPTYHMPAVVKLTGVIEIEALAQSLNYLVARHASLRTHFIVEAEQPRQVITPALTLPLPVVDARGVPEPQILALATEEVLRPFDLRTPSLLRAVLIRRDEREHWLVVTMHHIVSDGWSMGRFIEEVGLCYHAFVRKETPVLGALPIQYADFAVWQRETWARDGAVERQLAYWRTLLGTTFPPLELPTDFPRPAALSGAGASHDFRLPAEVAHGLHRLSQAEGATVYMTLLAAFQTFLYRYSGQRTFGVGSPIANRNRVELEPLIGFFVNTLVMRADLDAEMTFRDLLRHTRTRTLDAYAHQELPFEQLVMELNPTRDLSRSPLIQTLFVLQNAPLPPLAAEGLTLTPVGIGTGRSKFDLRLAITETPQGIDGALEYSTDLFTPATIAQMATHFATLVAGIVANPDTAVGRLPLLTEPDIQQLAVTWNDTTASAPATCLHTLIEAQAARTPDAIALVGGDHHLTYRELDRQSNRLAHYLQSRGVTTETRVGLFFERSVEVMVGLLAILKAGGAYVPLDPQTPAERIGTVFNEAGVLLVLTHEELVASLERVTAPSFCIASGPEFLADYPTTPPCTGVTPENSAYVLFTSGSTGRPKGVVVEHRQIVHYVTAILERADFPAQATFALVSTFAADLGNTVVFPALCTGGTLHILSYDTVTDPRAVAAYFNRHPIDCLKIVPSHFEAWLTAPDPHAVIPRHRLIFGGESSSWNLIERIRTLQPNVVIMNHYGPTETTVGVLTLHVPSNPIAHTTGVPLGRPLANTRMYVLDQNGALTPRGIPGELYIGGQSVTRGYLARPDLTAERYLPDPFSETPGARLYRTGDLVRYLPDGVLEFLGRVDFQVKIRGYRIELGEIEAVLRRHTAVRAAVVTAFEEIPGDKRLVAYLTLNSPTAAPELRTFLREALPEHMVPGAFVFLEALPLNTNGKIDRRALPAPDTQQDDSTTFTAPRTPAESQIALLMAQLLRVEQVGRDDNFFVRGGHSLLATRLMARLNQQFQCELPLRVLFEAPTVAELAARVMATPMASAHTPIPLTDRTRPLPLSFAQERLWLLEQLTPGEATYHIPAAVWLEGALDYAALCRSVTEVVTRHESIRTHFALAGDVPYQVIDAPYEVSIPPQDATTWDEATLHHAVARSMVQPFNLSTGPLFRVHLYQCSPTRHLFVLTLHHAISDGWSTGLFIQELAACYAAFRANQPSPLPPLALQYADFAAWQRDWLLEQGAERAQLAYWRTQLGDDLPALDLPGDYPRPAMLSGAGTTFAFEIGQQETVALQALSRSEGATLYMTLLAAFQVLLYRYSGQPVFGVGSPIANRTRTDLEPLIGFFVNTLVMKADLSARPSFRTLLRDMRERTLGAYAHQDVPFERLVAALQPARELNRTPLFQVMFVLQNAPAAALAAEGLTITPLEVGTGRAKFDLMLSLVESEQGLSGAFEYSTDLFAAATIERMATHFKTLLTHVLATPDQRVTHLTFLPAAEQALLTTGWNNTRRAYANDQTLHDLFTRQAHATPHATAIVYGNATLTYEELEQRSNQLAHYLRSVGVGLESFVGLSIERSLDMVTAILAILKTGGTYVPLDPTYPPERLHYILEDAGAVALITQSHLRQRLPVHNLPVFDLDADGALLAPFPQTPPAHAATAETLVYVMYTSGSTGRPKGVAVTHRNVARLVLNSDFMQMDANETFFQFSSISFDVSTLELWASLLNGGRLVVAPAGLPTLQEIGDVIRSQGVTALWLTAGLFHLMVEEQLDALVGVRQVVAGGDILSPAHVRRLLEARDGGVVINGYGPTENTTFTTCYTMTTVDQIGATVPIGYPITNSTVYILDQQWHLAPIGVYGELVTGGDGVAQGYFNRPDLTADKFIPDPFSDTPGTRLYRTGDVARWRADGTIEFLGRMDHQVKLRGFRIELGEIESVIRQHPAVLNTVLVVQGDTAQGKILVAYVVPITEGAVSASDIRAFLADRLPDYMVPSFVMVIAELPLNPNGKVDRRALPAIDAARTEASSYDAPVDDTERVIAALMANLLGLAQVGRHDNFFQQGGHSLLATQLMTRLNRHFESSLPLRTLFEGATVAELATATRRTAAVSAHAVVIQPIPRGAPLPLSFAQERLWVLEQIAPHHATYHIPAVWHLTGALNLVAFRTALTQLVARHEVLRTAFITVADEPYQHIAPVPDMVAVPTVDGSAWDEATLTDWIEAEIRRPFDLTVPTLLRVCLLQRGAEDHLLVLTLHHIIADGWSMGILMRELSTLYRAACQGQVASLPPLPIQYADFGVWQRGWLAQEGRLEQQLDYWRTRLGTAVPVLDLPTDYPRPPLPSGNGAIASFTLPPLVAQGIAALAQAEGATLYMTLLAAFYTLLYRYSGQSVLVVGSPIANRTRAEIEPLIGFFVNTLVLRADIDSGMSFRALMGQVRTRTLEAYAHQDIPFERLVAELEPTRDVSRSPLFQVMFTLQNAGGALPPLGDVDVHAVESTKGTAKFDLTLVLSEQEQGVAGVFEYSTDLFTADTITRMTTHFVQLVESIVVQPDAALDRLALLSAVEQHQLLHAWVPPLPTPPTRIITEVIAAHAQAHPLAIALADDRGTLTYSELEQRATQLAYCLRAHGVRSETMVGVFIDRSPDAVVALLAILKAGGAYVPLDTAYPAERLRMVVADSGMTLMLTTPALADRLSDIDVPLLIETATAQSSTIEQAPLPVPEGDTLAYMIYTSGSTGTPKGVTICHTSLMALVEWTIPTFELTAADHTMQTASLAFDASVWEIWSYLAVGATVFFPTDETRLSPHALQTYLLDHDIAVTFLPTPLAEQLLTLSWERAGQLRYLLTGGDRLRQVPPKTLPFTVVNNYGPTENTVVSTSGNVATDTLVLPTIGRALPHVHTYILDRHLAPVPIGVAGELYVGGSGVARGYWQRPALSAERFIPNPFSTTPGARLYRTGDMVRYTATGEIEFLGRADAQVKIRGFRIELGEIEAQLEQVEGIESAVVVAWDEAAAMQLVAYMVAAPDAPADEHLRTHLKAVLPAYMIPGRWVRLATIPLTPNGKVDRRALPAPDQPATTGIAYCAPRDTLEAQLVMLWERVLDIHPIGVHDNFFDIGGNSLLAVRVAGQMHTTFGRTLPLSVLFQTATVESLAAWWRDRHLHNHQEILVPLQQNNADTPPLYMVHPAGGNVLAYVPLVRALGAAYPVVGIQAPQEMPLPFEALAAHHVAAIQARQPMGPYYLLGWSLGGVLAYEMAHQLRTAGHAVPLVVLIDSHLPLNTDPSEVRMMLNFARDLGITPTALAHWGATHTTSAEDLTLSDVWSGLQSAALLPPDVTADQFQALYQQFRAIVSAFHRYTPPAYAGKVVLVQATQPAAPEDASARWDAIASNLQVHPLDGNHYSVLHTPQVEALAVLLQSLRPSGDSQ